LTNDQAEFVGAEIRTRVGSAYFGPEDASFRAAAQDVPGFPGEYVLDLHGTSGSVQLVDNDGRVRELSASEFAEVVRRSGWSGQPIRLFSCNTGELEGGFSDQLAAELEVTVTAPTAPVWSTSGGGVVSISEGERVFDPTSGGWRIKPVKPDTGRWRASNP
jgi:hypothetical protein